MSSVQGTFGGKSVAELGEEVGYRTSIVCAVTGLSARQIDHWAKTGFFEPSLSNAKGSGRHRLYTFKDISILKAYARLLDAGVHISKIKAAKEILKSKGIDDLTDVTLISDGKNVFLERSPEDIINILQNGQGIFAVSLNSICNETQGQLLPFKPVTIEEESIPASLQKVRRELQLTGRLAGNV